MASDLLLHFSQSQRAVAVLHPGQSQHFTASFPNYLKSLLRAEQHVPTTKTRGLLSEHLQCPCSLLINGPDDGRGTLYLSGPATRHAPSLFLMDSLFFLIKRH